MSRAVDQLVAAYLAEAHPRVARALRKDVPATAAPVRSPFGSKTLQEVVVAYRVQTSNGTAADSDDDEPVRKPASRKASPKPSAKKAPIPDSSSDDDEPVRKPAAKRASPKVSPKSAPKRAAMESDSDDDDAPLKRPTAVKAPAARASTDEPVAKAPRTEGARRTPHHLNEDGTFRRFQRIDPTKVTFHAEALRDNWPGDEHLVLRQNQEMMRVKGKGFNKLKQKNKGKFYGAGVDLSVRAFQFPDSDDE